MVFATLNCRLCLISFVFICSRHRQVSIEYNTYTAQRAIYHMIMNGQCECQFDNLFIYFFSSEEPYTIDYTHEYACKFQINMSATKKKRRKHQLCICNDDVNVIQSKTLMTHKFVIQHKNGRNIQPHQLYAVSYYYILICLFYRPCKRSLLLSILLLFVSVKKQLNIPAFSSRKIKC